jgi:hypothetical protein
MGSRNHVEMSMFSNFFDVRIRGALDLCGALLYIFWYIETCCGLLIRRVDTVIRNASVKYRAECSVFDFDVTIRDCKRQFEQIPKF